MKPLKIFDSDFKFLAEIDDYEYFSWTRRYRKYDSFTLHINRHKNHTEHLIVGNIIAYERDGKFRGGIIQHRELGLDENGKISETWVIVGNCLDRVFEDRIALHNVSTGSGYDVQNDVAETVMKHYVNINCVNAVNPDRNIPNLVIATNKIRGNTVKYSARFQAIAQVLEELSLVSGLGHEVNIDLDNKIFIFDVLEGKDLTAGQSINSPVIFSPEFDNIRVLGYRESQLDTKNVAIVAGQGEAAERMIEIVGSGSGINRREMFIDARDLEDAEGLIQRGNERLAELKETTVLEFETLPYSNFKYMQDYDLGDIVTINYPEIATMDSRIIEVTEEITTAGENYKLVVGKEYPDLISILKRDRKNTLTEVYR